MQQTGQSGRSFFVSTRYRGTARTAQKTDTRALEVIVIVPVVGPFVLAGWVIVRWIRERPLAWARIG